MNVSEIEASYPLTPMQAGMLFHHLYLPALDAYFGQAHWPITGPLNIPAFQAAWQRVVQRHTILRTSFDWSGPSGPVQSVHREATVPLECLDWRMLSSSEQIRQLTAFLANDRARGFNLAIPPLLRITVIRLGEDEHRIIWSGHHLLVDGRSINLVVREVMALYNGLRDGAPVSLPIPIPYSDFVSWLDAQDMPATEEYWRRTLRGFTVPTSLRTERIALPGDVPPGATESLEVRLSSDVRDALRSIARSSGVTLNTVIMAAWAVLSSRYSQSDDVIFGVTIGSGGRGAPLSRSLAGLIINTLPLRVRVGPTDSTVTLLHHVRQNMVDLKRHAHSPLVDVTRWSELPTGTPLFDTIVVFDNSALDRLATRYGALEIGRLTIEQHSSYPLNLVVQPGRELVLKLMYAPEYIDKDAVRRLGSQLEQVLRSMAAQPELPLERLSVLPEPERHEILFDWNATTAGRVSGMTLHSLFEEQARRSPDAIVARCGDRHITSAQLDRRANRLARRLRERGAGPETIVGIALERSIELLIAMVAVAKAGAACLLLDPQLPKRRVDFMLRDADALVCLTCQEVQKRLPAGHSVLLVDDAPTTVHDVAPLEVDVSDTNLAYVIYTSGTTGHPKGVAIEHRSAVNLVAWHVRAFNVTVDDRVTQLAGLGFDALLWEIWPNLAAGACICIPPDDVRSIPKALQAWLLKMEITVAFVPTPLAEALLALSWPKSSVLRTMLVGGDVLHSRPDISMPFELVNNYGPSECTVVATSGIVHPGSNRRDILPSIGRPIDNVETYLLDTALQPVPVGVLGELHIGGIGVGRGYLNQPELTAQCFIPHPFSDQPDDRLYKTGDLARYRPDGSIEFVGRLDNQVQLRGFRVELGEIEAVLRHHPAIHDAVVVARSDHRGHQNLVAYLVPIHDIPPSLPSIREHLRASLPEYMVPSAFVPVDAIPLSPNGKVDRAALPVPVPVEPVRNDDEVLPPSPVEKLLIGVWKSTLNVSTVSTRDNFFELGGNSLLAIELLEKIRLDLGLQVSLADLFQAPTVESLAKLSVPASSPPTRGALVPIQPAGPRPPFFCAAPVLGTVFPYYELAHAMRSDRPFYGLQPVLGLDDRRSAWTIECIAARYVEAIRQVQATGPYYLGGWSFGGLVAFEMAQQLQSTGDSVAMLVILDTPAPGLQHYLHAHQSLNVFAQTVLGGVWEYLRDYEYLVAESKAPRVRRVLGIGKSFLERAAIARVVPAESRLLMYHLPTIREMVQLFIKGLTATLRYRPSIYSGSVTLLRTNAHGAEGDHTALLGWDTVSSQAVQVRQIPGTHLTLLRQPHLQPVAQVLQAVIDEAHQAQEDYRATPASPAYTAAR